MHSPRYRAAFWPTFNFCFSVSGWADSETLDWADLASANEATAAWSPEDSVPTTTANNLSEEDKSIASSAASWGEESGRSSSTSAASWDEESGRSSSTSAASWGEESSRSSSTSAASWGEDAIFWERGLPPEDLTATLDLTLIRTSGGREREAVVPTKEEDSASDSGKYLVANATIFYFYFTDRY